MAAVATPKYCNKNIFSIVGNTSLYTSGEDPSDDKLDQ